MEKRGEMRPETRRNRGGPGEAISLQSKARGCERRRGLGGTGLPPEGRSRVQRKGVKEGALEKGCSGFRVSLDVPARCQRCLFN